MQPTPKQSSVSAHSDISFRFIRLSFSPPSLLSLSEKGGMSQLTNRHT